MQVNKVELTLIIVERNGKFHAQAWTIDTVETIFEEYCTTKLEAACALADFVRLNLCR